MLHKQGKPSFLKEVPMARLTLFSLGFLVYTAVAAISVAQHPAPNTQESRAQSGMAGVCASEVAGLNETSTL